MQNDQERIGAMIPAEIYDSPDRLDGYLADVRRRREQRRRERAQRAYWQLAIEKIQAELQSALCEDAPEIVAELEYVLAQFERRLGAPETLFPEEPTDGEMTVLEVSAPKEAIEPPSPLRRAEDDLPEPVLSETAPLPAEEAPVLATEEQQERLSALCARIAAVEQAWNPLEAEGLRGPNGDWNRPHCFRVRGLGCVLAQIQSEAQQARLEQEIDPVLQELRERIEAARAQAREHSACPPFDQVYGRDSDRALPPEAWEELARRYMRLAEAQAAWDWYALHAESLPSGTRETLLDAIAAAQQALFRGIKAMDSWDRLQEDLYRALLDEAKQSEIYLEALRPEMTDEDLEDIAVALPDLLNKARQEAQFRQKQQERESLQKAAFAAMETLFHQRPDLGKIASRLEEDQGLLFLLLDACLAAGIPPSNARIRDLLLEAGPRLLSSQARYAKFLAAVYDRRIKLGLDLTEVEEQESEEVLTEPVIAHEREIVSQFTRNLRILILGGVRRQHTCVELQEILGCADVRWPDSKKSDKAGKFEPEIKKADILILVKNFAGHDMFKEGREWIRGAGGHFLLLPGGYGVNQIIHQLYQYINSR